MPIPDFQTLMLPLLKLTEDGEEHTLQEAREHLAAVFDVSEDEQAHLLPSGKDLTFRNRVGWAKTYLVKTRLLESPKRGRFRITDRGRGVLGEHPDRIDLKYLERYEEFKAFRKASHGKTAPKSEVDEPEPTQTPDEVLAGAYRTLRKALASDLLDLVKGSTPAFFEKLVVDLLVAMGYGGSLEDAASVVGRSGDEGIDGVIKEDRLGLDVVYIQAKKWEGNIGRPELQKFVGALQGKRARKGVFLTTSSFTREAVEYVQYLDTKVILVDGEQLAEHMIDFDVGVSTRDIYRVKKIDIDYFEGE